MRVPISWLREYVALPQETDAIAERLAMLGFPIAEIERRPPISGVRIGRIAALEKHPNADRLQVASVDVGGGEALTIATAAANVAAGQTIAVATIGARLPQLTIAPRTMRGIASQGMMISADELALPPDWFEDGILQLDASLTPGSDAIELLGLNTDVLDVEVTSNRPDALSIVGLARELAASYDVPLRLPLLANPGANAAPGENEPRVRIESADCSRFVAQRIERVPRGAAPAWMRVRLALAGQRPIGAVVDVSNYVMLEIGQPLHFYDAAQIEGGTLIVRDAKAGEEIVTLDGARRPLSPQALVIADERRPLCLAGLMGAADGEVGPATDAIVLESANFNGGRVRRMSAALGLRTEASTRHEKSLPPALTDLGAARAAALLHELGATLHPPHAFGEALVPAAPLELKLAHVRRLLGIELEAPRIAHHLEVLGCEVALREGPAFAVTPPPWRRDLTIAADLVEEIARIEGYDRIPSVVPSVAPHEISSAAYALESTLAQSLASLHYREIVTHSMRAAGEVEVRNPLSEEQRFLRTSLIDGALEYLARAGGPVRIFEIGEIFARAADGAIAERSSLAFGFSAEAIGDPTWRDAHFLAIKGDCERLLRVVTGRVPEVARAAHPAFHPGKTAALSLDGRKLGIVGAIDPRAAKAAGVRDGVYFCAIDVAALPDYRTPRYRPPSKYPSTYRDLAVSIDVAVGAKELEDAVAQTLGSLCTAARVFDEYRGAQVGEGRKSLAMRVTLQRNDATLTDEEADAAVARLLAALRERFGAEIRT